MKIAEVISRLNSKCGWNLKNNGGFSHTQLMIIEDTHIIVTKEIIKMIDEMIAEEKEIEDHDYPDRDAVESSMLIINKLTELRSKL